VVAALTSTPMSRRTTRALLAGVLLLALALRLIGLRFGLPAVYNPDEIAIVSRTLAFAKGDLNPHNFLYPTFYFYVLFAWLGLSFVVSWITGAVASLAAFQTQFFVDPTGIYLAGRLLGVLCGTATVALVFLFGSRLAGAGAGLMSALFLAVAPGHVRDSHYVKHDVPVTLAIVAAQLAILRLLDRREHDGSGRGRPFVIAGALCGVACSTHYYAVFLALPLLIAIVFATAARGWRITLTRVLQAGIAAAMMFFALSPFLIVEPGTAWRDILANRQIVVDRAVAGQHGLFANLGVYLRMLWSEGVSWPIAIGSAIGALLLARDRWRLAIVVLAFPIAFLLFIANTVPASRYLNPVFPTCAALAAYAVTRLATGGPVRLALAPERRPESVSGRPPAGRQIVSSGRGIAFPWLIALLMALPGLVLGLRLDLFFRQADTRTLALTAIERTVPAGSTVLLQPYSVPLTQSRDSLIEALRAHGVDPARASTKFALRLALDPYPAPAYRTLFLGEGGLDQDKIYLGYGDDLDRAGVQFVVLKRYNGPDPVVDPLRARLERQGRLLTTVSPYAAGADAATRARVAPFLHNTDTPYDPALERPGPGIEVWQLRRP
jgi:MFS family permease